MHTVRLLFVCLFSLMVVASCDSGGETSKAPVDKEGAVAEKPGGQPKAGQKGEGDREEPAELVAEEMPPAARKKKDNEIKTRTFDLGQGEKEFHRVKVFYGTNRKQTGASAANDFYGPSRGRVVTYGFCEVTIPLTHKVGALEKPKWWKFEFSENPKKHVVLQKVNPLSWEVLTNQLNGVLASSSGRNAFVFVHGYNVHFKDAARRTAQIHHDLKFDGAPIFFSWPSQGEITVTSYTHDETNAKWSYSYLKEFLIKVATDTEADNIYLIAHSMGTRVLANAVTNIMTERPDLKKRFREIILAAPDIDTEVFINDLAPKLVEASRNTTLYASSNDKALQTSRKVHGGYPRAGDAGEHLIILPGIDTIDASGVDTSFLGHSYFAEAGSILRDIKELVGLSKPAAQRTFLLPKKRRVDKQTYFVVRKGP